MKIIKQITINNKKAKLLLMGDNKSIKILLDDKVIFESMENTWNNIKNSDKAQINLLEIVSYSYINKQNTQLDLGKLVRHYRK